jgi:hypothetical protein
MVPEFFADSAVAPDVAAALAALTPCNPFRTEQYAGALRALGQSPWLLGTKDGGRLVAGCYASLASGRLNRTLIVPSLPAVGDHDAFWNGLIPFCRAQRVTSLELDSFAGTGTRIPPLPGAMERRERVEYILDLDDPEWERRLARKHRQNIQKALHAGVLLRRTASADACRDHVRLMSATMARRHARGEAVPEDVDQELTWSLLLTQMGAAELFQAVAGADVLASAMIMRSARGAYNQSAGTSRAGMQCGASHFLMYEIARVLREESRVSFNLGGAEFNPGLRLFKSRFGAQAVALESASVYLGGRVRRTLTAVARSLRQSRANILGRAIPRPPARDQP